MIDFDEYTRVYQNFDKCMACLQDVMLMLLHDELTKQRVADRINNLLNNLDLKDENKKTI